MWQGRRVWVPSNEFHLISMPSSRSPCGRLEVQSRDYYMYDERVFLRSSSHLVRPCKLISLFLRHSELPMSADTTEFEIVEQNEATDNQSSLKKNNQKLPRLASIYDYAAWQHFRKDYPPMNITIRNGIS